MLLRHLSIVLTFFLISCGGSGSNDTSKLPPQPQVTSPVVTLSIDSASVDESVVVVITHSAKDYQNATITSVLSCDVGILEGNNYTAPSVAAETTASCTATATDSGNRSTTETLTLTINAVTPVLALANGATSATTAKLTTIDVSFADISEGLIDATLNGEAIKLSITADKQLVYFPPMGATGLQTLELTLEGEVVTYEYQAQDSSAAFGDAEIYVNDYFTRTKSKIDIFIQQKLENNTSAENIKLLNTFKDSLSLSNEAFSSLPPSELEYFAQIIFENNDFFEGNAAPTTLSNKVARTSLLPSKVSVTVCELEAAKTLVLVGTTTTLVGATVALASSGFGAPVAVASGVALIGSAILWRDSVGETYDVCIEPFITAVKGSLLGNKSPTSRISSPIISSKVSSVNSLAFFSGVEEEFTAQTQYKYTVGAESIVTEMISSYNIFSGKLNALFDLLGRDNIPDYAENLFSMNLDVNDFLYKDINPYNLNISTITDAGVTGGNITNINDNNSFELTFNIGDLEIPHIAFQFTITDSGHETPLSSVIDAEVTLNPPIAYDTTFTAVIGEEIVARLQADFETGFIIKEQPKFGTLDTSLDSFSMPGGGLFGYTPDENLTEDTTDTFTFVATNGSTKNGGESNAATVTIEVTAELDCTVDDSVRIIYSVDGSISAEAQQVGKKSESGTCQIIDEGFYRGYVNELLAYEYMKIAKQDNDGYWKSVLEGLSIEYDPDGTIAIEETYVAKQNSIGIWDHYREGVRSIYDNGIIRSETTYVVLQTKDGYWANLVGGIIREYGKSGTYIDGILSHESTKVAKENRDGSWVSIYEGLYQDFHSNGNIFRIKNYIIKQNNDGSWQGLVEGLYQDYNYDGTLSAESTWVVTQNDEGNWESVRAP